MKYFYFGTLPLFNVSVHENRVNVADSPIKEMIYVTHINTNNMFLLKSYIDTAGFKASLVYNF